MNRLTCAIATKCGGGTLLYVAFLPPSRFGPNTTAVVDVLESARSLTSLESFLLTEILVNMPFSEKMPTVVEFRWHGTLYLVKSLDLSEVWEDTVLHSPPGHGLENLAIRSALLVAFLGDYLDDTVAAEMGRPFKESLRLAARLTEADPLAVGVFYDLLNKDRERKELGLSDVVDLALDICSFRPSSTNSSEVPAC